MPNKLSSMPCQKQGGRMPSSSLVLFNWSGSCGTTGKHSQVATGLEVQWQVDVKPTRIPVETEPKPLVGIIMGSTSDWETLRHAATTLEELGIAHETRVVSAHRTPDLLFAYASSAEQRGIEV